MRVKIIILMMLSAMCFVYADNTGPVMSCEAAIAMDVDTHEVLFAKDMDRIMYPASTTKLMTAILLAENKSPGDILSYSRKAKQIEPSKLNLDIGDGLYAADAMEALVLYSANDIAYMIAESVSGDIDSFASLMNQKASLLNLVHTHFTNPHGLPDDNHYSSAYDISILIREIAKYPWIMESINKQKTTIFSLTGRKISFINKNKLAGINGCIAGKTGFTDEAGRCLAALYERDNRRIAAVVLKSIKNRDDMQVFDDMEALVAWAFSQEKKSIYVQESLVKNINAVYRVIPVIGYTREITLPVIVKEHVNEYRNDPYFEVISEIPPVKPWSLRKDKSIGRLVVKGKEISHYYPLYSTVTVMDLLKANLLFYGALLCAIVCLIAAVMYVRRKKV